MTDDLLSVENVTVEYKSRFRISSRGSSTLVAVNDVSLTLLPRTTLALVGESGSGKTSVGRAILGVTPISQGRVVLDGEEIVSPKRTPTRAQRAHMQLVFQQPSASLDPRMRIEDAIAEPLVYLLGMRGKALRSRVGELLEMVGLDASLASNYPRHLSGGQRQRVAIARAIGPKPKIIICDEPTTSLDVSVQAQVINLLVDLQRESGLSLLFISHNLGLVRQIADTVAVMYRGEIVQLGETQDVLDHPTDEYAQALIRAVPRLDAVDPHVAEEEAAPEPAAPW